MKPVTPLRAFLLLFLCVPLVAVMLIFAGALLLILWPFIAILGALASHLSRGLQLSPL